LLQWGLDRIAEEIRPDPIFRPLDYARKAAAEREWRRVVRETGKEQRRVVAGAPAVVAQQQIEQIIWEFQERRRRSAITFDADIRVQEQKNLISFQADVDIRRARALAEINAQYPNQPPVEDAFTVATRFERKIAEIRANPSLGEEEKHKQTLTLFWQRAMEAALANRGSTGHG
jgi:hypothetical protein